MLTSYRVGRVCVLVGNDVYRLLEGAYVSTGCHFPGGMTVSPARLRIGLQRYAYLEVASLSQSPDMIEMPDATRIRAHQPI